MGPIIDAGNRVEASLEKQAVCRRMEFMCVIIDASVAGRAFAIPCEDDFAPLWKWIEEKDGKLVFGLGGKFGKELGALPHAKRRVRELSRAGRAIQISGEKLASEERAIEKLTICKSNDAHVLALALASGTRVLCTDDQDLETDFKNPDIVSSPRGKIYKNASHRHLLKHNSSCIGKP